MAFGIIGERFDQICDKNWAFRARSDETHVSAHDIQDLHKFINAKFADDCAHSGDAGVTLGSPARTAVGLGIGLHAAKFENGKNAAVQSHPVLTVKDRSTAFEF